MADVKRLNYFTSQFLVEKDFTDEQGYHMNMRRRHNQLLHTWGIADGGLQVTKSADKIIGISSGMAIDKDGRELVLLDAQSKDLTAFGSNADVYITAKYEEVFDAGDHYTVGGIDNYTRTTERPLVEAGTTVPVNDGSVIVLAKVKLDGGGTIGSVDSTVRKIAGSAIDPTVNLAANSLSVTGNATVTGNVGIGTTTPSHKFHVVAADAVGLFESSGGQAYLRLSTNEGLGNRVEITNSPGGRLSLWTAGGGDVFNITKDGKVGIGTPTPGFSFDVTDRMRVRQGPSGTAGIWMYQTAPNTDRAFIGMVDDDHVGLWGNTGVGWGLSMNTANGNVGIGAVTPKKPLHIVRNPGVPNPIVIEGAFASDSDAKALLAQLPANSLIVGGAWGSGLYFYWRDNQSASYRVILSGTAF
ncbi:MAG: hypothetical protein P0120_17900 [Nitrospira sp.]|nr:hypothetical protein [Nitrospira sp.]